MNDRFVSLSPDAPAGFHHHIPSKRELLSGPIALFADTLAECEQLLEGFHTRVSGVVITRGESHAFNLLSPHLWHMHGTDCPLGNLRELAAFMIRIASITETAQEKVDFAEVELARGKRDYEQARSEYAKHASHLGQTVQALRSEIQQRKEAEKQLNVFKKFAENAKEGVGWILPDGQIDYLNPALIHLLGLDPNEPYTGKSVYTFFEEDEQQQLRTTILPEIVEKGSWSGEITMLHQGTNEPIPTRHNAFLIRDEQGQSPYLANLITDLRAQKKTEQELLKIKKLEAVGFLAGGIAHDFNNLLAVILGNLELAEMNVASDPNTSHLMEQARKATVRAKGLTQQLLTFAKGGLPILKETPIETIITESASFILHGSPVACHCDIPANLHTVKADPDQISQVIQNLIINACHAMPEGGDIHIVCTNAEHPEVLDPDLKQAVRITISDTGHGIDPEHIGQIFDPYFSLKEEGSGLGLAICHSVIQKHGGTISVESKPGTGTTFTILLPGTTTTSGKAAEPHGPRSPEKKRKLRVLVMDDEPMVRTISQRVLTRLGHEALVAKDGREAIDVFKNQQQSGEPIDITIMDLTIPGGMGGKEAVLEIRTLDPTAVVIVSSGYSGDPVMANFDEYGFTAAIAKPFEIAELKDLIESLMV